MDMQAEMLELQKENEILRKEIAEHGRKIDFISSFAFEPITNTFVKRDEPADKHEHFYCPFCLVKFKAKIMAPQPYTMVCAECRGVVTDAHKEKS